MKRIRMLTFIPLEEIEAMDRWDASRINEKKEVLAYSLTALVHGEEEAEKAQRAARALFSGSADDSNMPATSLTAEQVPAEGLQLVDLMVLCGLTKGRGEGRRLIEQGGVSLNGEKVADTDLTVAADALRQGVVIRKGKKVFHKAQLS